MFEIMKNTIYLIRGLPGSGKTTLARHIQGVLGCAHFEADQFFTKDNGVYDFNPKLLGAAHENCHLSFLQQIRAGRSVIVSNTFTTEKEIRKYIDDGLTYGMRIVVITCHGDFGSIHNIPDDVITKMKNRFVANLELEKIFPTIIFQDYNNVD